MIFVWGRLEVIFFDSSLTQFCDWWWNRHELQWLAVSCDPPGDHAVHVTMFHVLFKRKYGMIMDDMRWYGYVMLYIYNIYYIYKYGMIWTCRCQTALLRRQTLTGPGKHLESFGYGEARIGWTKDHRSGHLCPSHFDHISSFWYVIYS